MTDPSPTRWGILGPGNIAGSFARDLPQADHARLVAVASSDKARAEAFGARHGVDAARCYGSYEQLAHDPEVDAVYVARPHPMHYGDARMLLEAGKAVLCEKPLTVNAREAQALVDLARARGVLLMEAMWTRWVPSVVKLRDLLRAGAIGEVRRLHADFSFRTDYDPEGRLFKPELGGGALLDVGVYPVSFASMLFGEPRGVKASATLTPLGVDEQFGMLLEYQSGALAVLSGATRLLTEQTATVYGTEGSIRVGPAFFHARQLTVSRPGQADEVLDFPFEGGYQFEANEVRRLLRAGLTESPDLPLDESVAVLRTLDRAREQIGLRYPFEAAGA